MRTLESLTLPLSKGDRVEFLYYKDKDENPMKGTVEMIARGSGGGNMNIPVFRVKADKPPSWYKLNDGPINFHPRAALKILFDEN